MRRIAIIGGGAAGAWAAITLARNAAGPLALRIFEPRAEIGRGLAYSSASDFHRLNVPAWKMDVGHDPELPSFVEWLVEAGHFRDAEAAGARFVPRHLYGSYLAGLFRRELRADRVDFGHRRIRVEGVTRSSDGRLLVLAGAGAEPFDDVVLATGNTLPRRPAWLPDGLRGHPGIHPDPWSDAISAVREGEVAVVGSGLTSLDVALKLREAGHRDRITLVSRRGLLPLRDALGTTEIEWPVSEPPVPPSLLLRRLRHEVAAAARRGIPWQAVVDTFRAASPPLWKSLPQARQDSVWRHAYAFWSVHRQRVGDEVLDAVEAMRAQGSLALVAGRIGGIRAEGRGFVLEVRRARDGVVRLLKADHIVNCSGLEPRPGAAGNGLLNRMLREGLLFDHPGGVGARSTEDGRAADPAGRAVDGVHLLGGLLRGHEWEAVSVPAIRVHVDRLVSTLRDARASTCPPTLRAPV